MDLPNVDAVSGSDNPERVLAEFWDDIKQLLVQENTRRITQGRPQLNQQDLAEHVGVSRSTFNGWWTKGTVPAEFLPLAQIAEFLGGDRAGWLDRCRRARAAHLAILAGRRSDPHPQPGRDGPPGQDQRIDAIISVNAPGTSAPGPQTPPRISERRAAEQPSDEPEWGEHDSAADINTDQPDSSTLAGATRRRKRSQRVRVVSIAAAIIVIAVAAPFAWSWYQGERQTDARSPSLGPSDRPTVEPTSGLLDGGGRSEMRVKTVQIPLAALSSALSALIAPNGSTTATGVVFTNDADNLCLGANTSGPEAGQNHDKVQLAPCAVASDAIWIPAQWDRSGDKLTWLVNYRYQSKCLNADNIGGVRNGHRVQLWDCYDSSNEDWSFADWYNSAIQGTPTSIRLSSGALCLDADRSNLGEGDQVLVWTAYGARNQLWY